jgi:hypothetical protein
MGQFGVSDVLGSLLAALSGVVVAIFTHALSLQRDAGKERRLLANARTLLALEVWSNRAALRAFWEPVNGLDAARHPAESVEHLAGMYENGLLTYTLPAWSFVRWEGIEPRTIAALTSSEVTKLDALYRTLRDVTDLYSQVVTVTSDDWTELRKNVGGRFWTLDLARERLPLFIRLSAAVARTLEMPDPLPGALPDRELVRA